MIVYVKNNYGVRQLEEINDIGSVENKLYGMYVHENWDGRFIWDRVWKINFADEERAIHYHNKIRNALDNHKDSCLIHIYDKEVFIE